MSRACSARNDHSRVSVLVQCQLSQRRLRARGSGSGRSGLTLPRSVYRLRRVELPPRHVLRRFVQYRVLDCLHGSPRVRAASPHEHTRIVTQPVSSCSWKFSLEGNGLNSRQRLPHSKKTSCCDRTTNDWSNDRDPRVAPVAIPFAGNGQQEMHHARTKIPSWINCIACRSSE